MIIADTGALLALVDRDDRHHVRLRTLFVEDPGAWIIPWAVLPEVDYLLAKYLGTKIERLFQRDLARGMWTVEWGTTGDLVRAEELNRNYPSLELGLVDGVVIAVAERLRATAIATLDVRDIGSVAIRGTPKIYPRDL